MREGDFRQMQAPTTGSTGAPVDVGCRAPFMAAPARAALARSHVGQRILSFVVAWVTLPQNQVVERDFARTPEDAGKTRKKLGQK